MAAVPLSVLKDWRNLLNIAIEAEHEQEVLVAMVIHARRAVAFAFRAFISKQSNGPSALRPSGPELDVRTTTVCGSA